MIATTPRRAEVALRPMRRSDLDAVLAIEQRAFPQPWTRGFFEKELAMPQAACVVATLVGDAGTIVGYSVCWSILDERHLLNVAVHPDHRSLGVGRRLMDAVLEAGRASGGRVVYLEVRAGNVAARRLYKRLGFRELGVRRGYYGPGQDAIVMELRLGTDA
jgi:ribosomal-protein-alanine N-acetyltransferase